MKKRPGLGVLVLAGFGLGVAWGLFFGEMAAALDPVGRAYVRLLQMAVIPYIMVSLVAGLGRLSPQQASRIALWGGTVLLAILTVAMVIVLSSPLAYPDWDAASYFSSSLLTDPGGIDFLSLYIPSNPFSALAGTVVPAVVLFSVVMGVAVMISGRKQPLLELLDSVEDALMNVTRFVVKLAPIGIFAISANAAGTLDVTTLDKLQVFVLTTLVLWTLCVFLLFPVILAAFTPVGYRELFAQLRIPLVTGFVTGSVLVVLPQLIQRVKFLLEKHGLADEETDAAVDVVIPTAYNFPFIGTLMALSFVPFAGWYAGSELTASQYPQFAFVGLFVAFGGVNIALPFMLDLFHLPADMFQLFLVSNVITNFFFTALSVMQLAVMTLLTLFLVKRATRFSPIMLAVVILVGTLGVPLALKAQGALVSALVDYEYTEYDRFVSRSLITQPVPSRATEYFANTAPRPMAGRIERITKSGVLRVGYTADALPWAFRNSQGQVVGYDMELLHRMARDLDASLEVMRLERDQVRHALDTGQIDLFASGVMMQPRLTREYTMSKPYTSVTLGILAEDHRRQEFESARKIREAEHLSLAVVNAPSVQRTLESLMPGLEFTGVESPRGFLRGELEGIDALVMAAETASAWTLVYPDFTTVIPGESTIRIPVTFILPNRDEPFREYVNDWLTLSASVGTSDRAYQHWILGQDVTPSEPRWSVVRDVLGWVE